MRCDQYFRYANGNVMLGEEIMCVVNEIESLNFLTFLTKLLSSRSLCRIPRPNLVFSVGNVR